MGGPAVDFDVICLSTNHWTGLPTSKQHLMSIFARSRRVLYVDPPTDVFSVLGRKRRWQKLRGLRRVEEGLWVLSPVSPVVSSDPDWALEFYTRLAPRVDRAASELGLVRRVVWTFAPEHAGCARRLPGDLLVYQAADEPATKSRNPARTTEIEREHIEESDIVFVVSDALLSARRRLGNVHRLPNAADRRHYARVLTGKPDASIEELLAALREPRVVPDELPRGCRPVVMFGGAAYSWFDSDILLDVARARPDFNFLLVGPLGHGLAARSFPDNVKAVGRRSYEEFVWYVASSDVGIIPLRKGESARNCDPIVMYEFLLCGKPVVATEFPAAQEHAPMVRTASDPASFAEQLDLALEHDVSEEGARRRAEFGFFSTWEDRARTALGMVGELVASRGSGAEGQE
jgi:glycosyltransferase involved in cell wall biosynthesis